jgi:hypothetical protein
VKTRSPTSRRSWRGPASVRRPSRLVQRNLRGVTPPASRASHAGRRRAASASARRPWPRSLAPDPLGGRAEQSIGSVGIVAAIGTAQDGSRGVFAAQRQQKHISAADASARSARSSLSFARHLPVHGVGLKGHPWPVPGKTAVCSGFGSWFARAACPSAAIYAEEFCQQARRSRLGSGSKVLPHSVEPKNGQSTSRQECACLCSRKVEGLPLRRPTHGSTRQDAECRARRPSRLVQR